MTMTPQGGGHGEDATTLAACGLAPSTLAALFQVGFRYKSDLTDVSVRELVNETGLSAKIAANVLDVAAPIAAMDMPVSALDLLREQERLHPISTMLDQLDVILGGGMPRGEVTEIYGSPGVGKTQMGMHLCLAAQCDIAEAGVPVTTVYIDTEGSFVVERVASMAEAMINQHRAPRMTRDDLLRGITYFRAHDFVEQLEVLHTLPELLRSRPDIRLIVIDSIAFHFRHGFEDYSQRARALDAMALQLQQLAADGGIAVVLINQTTSKTAPALRRNSTGRLGSTGDGVPALGDSWAHAITNRVLLSWESNTRTARVVKSSCLAQGVVHFEVNASGLHEQGI